jgi:drug/metabolite transporter (DMT)-like permease
MDAWVLFTLLAVLMQTIRTAGQKKLSASLSPMATTMVRYLFGLPFALIYLLVVFDVQALGAMPASTLNSSFLLYASLAGLAQIAATYWLIKLFSLRSFAVGTIFTKTEAFQAAILGMIFFSADIPLLGWLAVILGSAGILLIGLPTAGLKIDYSGVKYGVLAGLGFAFTAIWLRQSSVSLEFSFVQNAALTLVYTVSLQTVVCLVYIFVREPDQLATLKNHLPIAIFVGITSALGSVGWYTAVTYQTAALVRSLGQIEIVLAVTISYLVFNEKVSARESFGMVFIVVGALILLLFI